MVMNLDKLFDKYQGKNNQFKAYNFKAGKLVKL